MAVPAIHTWSICVALLPETLTIPEHYSMRQSQPGSLEKHREQNPELIRDRPCKLHTAFSTSSTVIPMRRTSQKTTKAGLICANTHKDLND